MGLKLPDVRRDGNRLRGCLKILEETRILDEFLLLPTSLGQLARTWAECPQTMTSSGSWRKLTKVQRQAAGALSPWRAGKGFQDAGRDTGFPMHPCYHMSFITLVRCGKVGSKLRKDRRHQSNRLRGQFGCADVEFLLICWILPRDS